MYCIFYILPESFTASCVWVDQSVLQKQNKIKTERNPNQMATTEQLVLKREGKLVLAFKK